MDASSPGKLLPQVILLYAHGWAERSGLDLLSKLLADAQFRELVERYGDELYTNLAQPAKPLATAAGSARRYDNGDGRRPSPRDRAEPRNGGAGENLGDLSARVSAIEARHAALQNTLEALRLKLTPVGLALGCCPECLVGLEGCPRCAGEGTVGRYPPELTLLESEILEPLSVQGVRLNFRRNPPAPQASPSIESAKTKRRRS